MVRLQILGKISAKPHAFSMQYTFPLYWIHMWEIAWAMRLLHELCENLTPTWLPWVHVQSRNLNTGIPRSKDYRGGGGEKRKHLPVNLTILKNAFALKCSFWLVLVSQIRYVLFTCIADEHALDLYLFESCLREVLADLAWCLSNLTVRPLGMLWCDNRVYH